jgi:hypothetical protein
VAPKRKNAKTKSGSCHRCTGLCCRYFALPIETPETWKDFDDIRWYLAHENISIFVEKGDWYLNVHNRCQHLAADHRCDLQKPAQNMPDLQNPRCIYRRRLQVPDAYSEQLTGT